MKQFNAVKWKWLLAPVLVLAASNSFGAEPTWKDEFVGRSGNSPFVSNLIKQNALAVRPLLKIGNLQAWAVEDDNGQPALALTTDEGLTIIGKVFGPQGEDISSALLATVPNEELASRASAPADPGKWDGRDGTSSSTETGPQSELSRKLTGANSRLASAANLTSGSVSKPGSQPGVSGVALPVTKLPASSTSNLYAGSTDDNLDTIRNVSAVTAVDKPSPEVQAGLDRLLADATSERLWFKAATPQPGAPVVYMLTDPECPHCQWAIDKLRSQIISGQIDLRIIPAPITGPGGFTSALSILHSDNVASTFMNHMTSETRGTPAVVPMDTAAADKNVIRAIADNIQWMRRNGIRSVPFFFYKDATGAKFSASALPDNILQVAESF